MKIAWDTLMVVGAMLLALLVIAGPWIVLMVMAYAWGGGWLEIGGAWLVGGAWTLFIFLAILNAGR